MNIFLNKKHGIAYTLIMLLLLIGTIIGVISYMYDYSEKEAFERLKLETAKQKESITLQMTSDRETLYSMANLLGASYHDNDEYIDVCQNFKSFGLCRDIGILIPGDMLITKHGLTNVSGKISFDEEASKGSYISGRIADVTKDERQIIRNVVPICDDAGNTKAILFGTISIEDYCEYYKNHLDMTNSYLCILDGKSGDFIIDTKDVLSRKNVTRLAQVQYKKGYTYKDFYNNLSEGKTGYTSFVAHDSDEFLYICYDEMGIENWRIMLAQPESVVLANVYSTVSFLLSASAILCLIILLYCLGIALSNRKKTRLNFMASEIRKNLLEVTHRKESLIDALHKLVSYAKARSAFISDSYTEECHYMMPEVSKDKLTADEIKYFNNKLLMYTAQNRKSHGVSLYSCHLKADRKTKAEMPEFYEFMISHRIYSVIYDVVINSNSTMYVIGVLNPKNKDISQLLNKIAACFSMAVYNRKHLERTHKMALTDALTGVKNRTAFSQDKKINNYLDSDYFCIYIDVNELNYYNNKYGHAAGDQMLKFIGEVLTSTFSDSDIYRMGGDEFLILNKTCTQAEIDTRLERIIHDIEEMKYHIAVGCKLSIAGTNLEDTVNEAEKMMYENKSHYYQDKELHKVKYIKNRNVALMETGVKELDACLSVMTIRYMGIYFVSLDKDSCVKILAPSYFDNIDAAAYRYSINFEKYINDFVKPEYHRALLTFLDYDILKKHFKENHIPEISFERIDGEKIKLKIYCINIIESDSDCIWVFENDNA